MADIINGELILPLIGVSELDRVDYLLGAIKVIK